MNYTITDPDLARLFLAIFRHQQTYPGTDAFERNAGLEKAQHDLRSFATDALVRGEGEPTLPSADQLRAHSGDLRALHPGQAERNVLYLAIIESLAGLTPTTALAIIARFLRLPVVAVDPRRYGCGSLMIALRRFRAHVALMGPHGWYVSEVGLPFLSSPLTAEEALIVRAALGRRRFRMKECFWNAQRLLLADKTGSLTYVEGFVGPDTHHAWCAINQKVIDATVGDGGRTLQAGRRILGTFDPDRLYLGVPLPKDVALSRPGATALDDWEHGHPIVREYERRSGRAWSGWPAAPVHLHDGIPK